MTLASTLYGGAGHTRYRAGNLYPAIPVAIGTAASIVDQDYIIPFSPRVTMTLDRVAWYRDNTSAANVRVGLYSSAGVLLTDCAVDTNTVAGWHLVDTTNVSLAAGDFYWLCWNGSSDVAGTQTVVTSAPPGSPAASDYVSEYGIGVGMGAGSDVLLAGTALTKTRANAALLSTLVMAGWSEDISGNPFAAPAMGVIPA